MRKGLGFLLSSNLRETVYRQAEAPNKYGEDHFFGQKEELQQQF